MTPFLLFVAIFTVLLGAMGLVLVFGTIHKYICYGKWKQ